MKSAVVSAAVALAVLVAGPAGGGETGRQHNLCYTHCQVECYYLHPNDPVAADLCRLQCIKDRCGG